jgi:hypothetical protein
MREGAAAEPLTIGSYREHHPVSGSSQKPLPVLVFLPLLVTHHSFTEVLRPLVAYTDGGIF